MSLLRAYLHPASLTAVVVLLVNDHVLKGQHILPEALTGKLSDFAGLFFFPLLCATLTALITPARFHRALLAACCWTTAAVFAAVQLNAGAAQALLELSALLGPSSVTADPTDLIALPMAWLAWRHGSRMLGDGETRKEENLLTDRHPSVSSP